MSSGPWRWSLAAIASAAGLARLAHVLAVLRSPIGDALVQDARVYHESALRILGTLPRAGLSAIPFNNLGYPYVLAGIYALTGPRPAVVLVLQALFGGVTAALLALAVRDILGSAAAGCIAGALYALARTSIFYDGLLLTPSLTDAALVAALVALGRRIATGRNGWTMASGAALGGAILLRTNLVLAVPVFAWASVMAGPGGVDRPRRRLGTAALLTACALAGPLAVTAGTAARTGAWVPLTANGGMNFWLGNNVAAQGVYYVAPFLGDRGASAEEEAFLVEARARTADPTLSLAGANRYWLGAGLAAVREAPRRWLLLSVRKAALFANGAEAKTNVSLEFVSAFSPVLRFTPVRMAALLALGAAGLVLMALSGERRAFVLFGGIVLSAVATCTLFFVSGEYRHAALPALCAATAWTLVEAFGRAPAARRTVRWAAAGVAIGAMVLAGLPWSGLRYAMPLDLDAGDLCRAIVRPAAGGAGIDPGSFARARALLEQAPGSPEGRIFRLDAARWLARTEALERHDRSRAAEALEAARALLSEDLGGLRRFYDEELLTSLRAAAAADVRGVGLQPFVAADPALAREAALLGAHDFGEAKALLDGGRPEEARAFLDEALRLTPRRVEPAALLGKALYALGDRAGAVRAWEASCGGWPRLPECAFFVAEMRAREGDTAGARAAADEALRRDPSYVPAFRLRSELR